MTHYAQMLKFLNTKEIKTNFSFTFENVGVAKI